MSAENRERTSEGRETTQDRKIVATITGRETSRDEKEIFGTERRRAEEEERIINQRVSICFGQRYVGASLAKIEFGDKDNEVLSKFLEKPKNFLVFTGNAGIGKTYFCAALYYWASKKFNTIRYWKENDLYEKIRSSISRNEGDYLKELHYMIDDELLIIDDLGISKHNEWREEILFELVDERYRTGQPTAFTSNLSRKQFKEKYHERIYSRLFCTENMIVEIHQGEDRRMTGE